MSTISPSRLVPGQAAASLGASTPRPACILVLGMHRSGTSALTRVLNLLGAQLPSDLAPATERNPTGFWEWVQVYQLHNEILAEIDSRWDDWSRIDPAWFTSARGEAFAQRLADMLVAEFGGRPLIVVKDPRACRLAPLWKRASELAGIELLPALIVRHPLDVAASLAVGKSLNRPHALLLWLRHVLEAEAATRDAPRVILTYDSLLADWRQAMQRTGQRLDVTFPRWSASTEQDIDGFLDPARNHHHARTHSRDGGDRLVRASGRAYRVLCKLALKDHQGPALRTLDEIGAEFELADSFFGSLHRATRQDLRQLTRKREIAETTVTTLSDTLEKARSRIEALEIERVQTKRACADARKTADGLTFKLEKARSRIEDLEIERRQTKRASADARKAADGLTVKLNRRVEELREARRQLHLSRVDADGAKVVLTDMQDVFLDMATGEGGSDFEAGGPQSRSGPAGEEGYDAPPADTVAAGLVEPPKP